MQEHLKKITRRYAGRALALGNEDAAAAAAEEMVAANALTILDSQGNAVPIASRDGATVTLGNASAALAGTQHQHLTTFATGYPRDEIDALAQFLAPYVEAPIKFSYNVNPKANAYLAVEDDEIGISGLPAVIQPDAKTLVESILQWRGLETTLTDVEKQIAAAMPGGSLAMEEEDRIAMLVDATRRGRLLRAVALAAATTGAATGKTWDSSANPIADLRAEIKTIGQLCGGPANVAILFGCDAWEIMIDQAKLAGGTNYAYQIVDKARVAAILGLRPENIEVSYLQVVNSKQGKTTTTTGLMTAGDVYLFARFPAPNRRDGSFLKTFAMRQGAGWYEVYSYLKHPKVTAYGLNYYERMAVTNSSAVKRLAISAS